MRRLLHVREMEEEQHRAALESALAELHSLEHALLAARARRLAGQYLLASSIGTPELIDRTAAIVEVQTASRRSSALVPRITAAERDASLLRQAYLEKRIERRQAYTLIEEAEAQQAIESSRSGQQSLDEAFGSSLHRKECRAAERRINAKAAYDLIDGSHRITGEREDQ
jgi:hypothetical protein